MKLSRVWMKDTNLGLVNVKLVKINMTPLLFVSEI